jgi:chromosome segregation ATPase
MSVTDRQGNKITASAVGSIVGMQSDQIQEIAGKYAEKQAELEKQERHSPKMTGAHQHKRMKAALQKQIEQQQTKLEDVQRVYEELKVAADNVHARLQDVEGYNEQINDEWDKLSEMETEENQGVLSQLRNLVAMNENLKKQEQDFRAHCKEEMERLQAEIEAVKRHANAEDTDDEQTQLIDNQYKADKEKLSKIRLLLARKNREISALQRKIDEVPTRAELSQYQRRFVELYNQVATKHKETKQFYTLYNTLDDTKLYLNKEVNLLNSIYDTFEQAMASPGTKEQFLKQFEQIVEGVKQNFNKLEKKKQEEKMRRDRLNDEYLDLIDKQRVYYKTVKDFQEECRKNEILLAKLE